ncbi:MAG: Tad domain-containing protein [Proteobacteria bacterium]|nr:Tad domain-containing protein [Pseudomonadota bacterium]
MFHRPLRSRVTCAAHQRGAMILTTALLLLFLLGFMGIAVDFGRFFVIKSEMQTAMDSCALAAAQELDTGPDALARATSAGKSAGNANKIQFQGEGAGLLDADITFSDSLAGTYSRAFAPVSKATYAKCTHTRDGLAPWLLQAMSGYTGDNQYKATNGVFALAVATRSSAQSACAIPVQINPRSGGAPNWGYTPGEWISALYDENSANASPAPGHFGWANLDGSTSATATKSELLGNGYCDLRTGDSISTTGAKFSASVEWNSRFGLYKNGAGNPSINTAAPDLSGYSYTSKNWSTQSGAAGDFLSRRATNRSYGDVTDTVNAGDTITGLNIKGGYKSNDMGTYAAGANALATHGGSRRLVQVPFVVGNVIKDWACVLMLHPIDSVKTTIYIEYVGNAASPSSPCSSAGMAGGTSGPLVPVLVQ